MEAKQPTSANFTVFIVDDDPAARESVAALVGSHDLPTQTFASAAEFLAAFKSSSCGCLVVDVRMTGMTGLELQQELIARGLRIPVIVITGFADIPTAVGAMKAGAVTFLEKPCSDKELWASIETALQWETRSLDERARREEIVARRDTLTRSEVQVLERLIDGKANKTIAAELDLGLRTVELRRATIMKKMEANSLAELIRLILSIDSTADSAFSVAGKRPSGGAASARPENTTALPAERPGQWSLDAKESR